tara:strand:+ start:2300 stop:2446 length:147 start_codon:yes stop_codon:yes gene_type:complete
MKDEDLTKIVENIGFEQILVDAELTVEMVALILNESGYLNLEMYEEEL